MLSARRYKRLKIIASVSYTMSVLLCLSMIGTIFLFKGRYLSTFLLILCNVFIVVTVIAQVQINEYDIDNILKNSGDNSKKE